jgi:hypothetical protein
MNADIFSALIGQLLNNPASLLLILPVSILAFVFEKWKWFPSNLILPVCLASGMCLFPGLVNRSSVPTAFPHPLLVLILNGFILGFVAWAVHITLVKWLIGKFSPAESANPNIADNPKPPKP